MKLTYRGISYDYNPPAVAIDEGKIAGKFRGLDWRFHNHKKPMTLQPNANLTYRGVAYNNQPQADTNTPTTSVKESARWLMLKKEKAAKNRTASMLTRTASELGLA